MSVWGGYFTSRNWLSEIELEFHADENFISKGIYVSFLAFTFINSGPNPTLF